MYKKVLTIGNNSLDKNYKRKSLDTNKIGNNNNLPDSTKYLSLFIKNNINSKTKKIKINNNLPFIQSSYYNSISNKNMFDNNNSNKNDLKNNNINNIINLKHISKFTLNKKKIIEIMHFLMIILNQIKIIKILIQ